MQHNVGELKAGVQGLLQNINLSKVTNLNGAIEAAARVVVQQADVPEASGKESLTLYGGVDYYLAPSTIFGSAINLIRRQGDSSSPLDVNIKVPMETFTLGKHRFPNGYMMDVEYDNGTALLGISTPIPTPKVVLDQMNATTGWTAAGSASNLTADYTVYYQAPASLRFLLTGSSTGTLTKTLTSPVNLSSYEDVGVAFLAIRIPDGATASNLTSVALKLGSSASAYDSVSSTEGFLGAWTAGDWLLVALNFQSSSSTGTPDWSAIDYIQVSLAHTATLTNFRVGGLWISLPSPNEILFQSSAIFMASGAAPLQTITGDGDTVILNDAAYTLLEHESALRIAIQQGGDLASGQVQMLRSILYGSPTDQGLYNLYRGDNPSESLRTVGSWYNPY